MEVCHADGPLVRAVQQVTCGPIARRPPPRAALEERSVATQCVDLQWADFHLLAPGKYSLMEDRRSPEPAMATPSPSPSPSPAVDLFED